MKKSVESIFTRAISILSKFFLITFLIKVLSLEEYGTFQLITYIMLISIYIYGLEFYMYSNREVAKDINSYQTINKHINFFITLFPFTFFMQLLFFYLFLPHNIWSLQIVLFLFMINLSEYFSQEVYRYLIALKEIRKANFLLITKSLLFLMFISIYFKLTNQLTLIWIIYLMLASYIVVFTLSLYFFIQKILKRKRVILKTLSVEEIKKIFKLLSPFIILMIFMKGLEFSDKFLINYFHGLEAVGIYSFLFSIAMLIHIFVVSGFYIIYLPSLIQKYENKNKLFHVEFYKLSILIGIFTIILSISIVFTIHPLLELLEKTEIYEHIDTLYLLLIALIFLNFSLLPNLLLYITHQEKSLMVISGMTFIINIFFNLILLQVMEIKGAAIALIITYMINLIFKSYKGIQVWKETRSHF